MKRQTLATSTAITIFTAIAAGMCGGCDASGYPAFVKISSDGGFIVYQDGSYPRTYIYDAHRKRKEVFEGYAACMNKNLSLLVLRGKPDRQKMKCSLMVLEPGGLTVSELPDLPMSNHAVARVMFIGEGPNMLALLYDSTWAERPSQALNLAHRSKQWEKSPVPHNYHDQPLWTAHEPIGDRLSGYVFSPRDGSFRLPEGEEPGLDVELTFDNNHNPYYILKSPRGDYTITIRDPNDPWKRLWLTEASGKRALLLDQNDMPARGVRTVARFPAGLFMSIFGPRI